MFEKKRLHKLEDFFVELNKRQEKGIYVYRINGWTKEIEAFIRRYEQQARKSGVVIQGKIPNPDEKNLAYYDEMMGMSFELSPFFINSHLKKWLPRMNEWQREYMSDALYATLNQMAQEGKNLYMLKNAYIKYMCWLYYKFERIMGHLGMNQVPKILYEGSMTDHELRFLSLLGRVGCDVLIVQCQGEGNYERLDPNHIHSYLYECQNLQPFPEGFDLQQLQQIAQKEMSREKLYGKVPEITACTNLWTTHTGMDDLLTQPKERGMDAKIFYNYFYRISGVENKVTYINELYQLRNKLLRDERKVLILENKIPVPTPEEIGQIQRGKYDTVEQLIGDLIKYIVYATNNELQNLIRKAFVDTILEEEKEPNNTINRLMNKAIYLICWLKRYQSELFGGHWKMPQVGCCIYLGGCQNPYEVLFIRLLSRLPIDLLILKPNQQNNCYLKQDVAYEIEYKDSLEVHAFPKEDTGIHIGTAAYHAENELNTLLYQDSGLYRNQQYKKAHTIKLKTMYEELFILWDKELKYRENFSVLEDIVNVPVLFAKVSGVKDGNVQAYWDQIESLYTEETLVIKKSPYVDSAANYSRITYVTSFLKNGKLEIDKIKNDKHYSYSFLREDVQAYILDKLQLLIEQKWIKGTFENGTEYTIIRTILEIDKAILRMIQNFDFTKKNPKIIYVHTTEKNISLEDSILMVFLHLIGFDILFFVPTGYQTIERFLNNNLLEEHQVGHYVYDLSIPEIHKSGTQKWYRSIKRYLQGG